MKQIYEGIANILLEDQDLKNMVGYTNDNKCIRRSSMPIDFKDKAVIFYLQPEAPLNDFEISIRQVSAIVRIYDKQSDLHCNDIGERVILLLDGGDLSVEGCYVYNCMYGTESIATSWNDNLKTFERVLRFDIQFRTDIIVGNSGMPTTRRKE